jgi:hypothetical protein
VKEQDVKEYVEDLRLRFYGELENVLIAVMQYAKSGKAGGLLELQKPMDPQPDSEQARIRMIATELVRRAIERQRFFAEPLLEMDEVEEAIGAKRR